MKKIKKVDGIGQKELSSAVEEFIRHCRLKNLSPHTIEYYSEDLKYFMQRSQLKQLRPHQKRALEDVVSKFKTAERGKLIMACGTGKTFTSLRIAEAQTQGKGNVLFLVPSISLLNQSLTEWSAQCVYDYHVYAICSDPKASKTNGDSIVDTAIPATTDVQKLIARYHLNGEDGLHLFFSTYPLSPFTSIKPNHTIMLSLISPLVKPSRNALTGISRETPFNTPKMNSTFVKAIHLGKTVLPLICSQNHQTNTGSISASLTGTSHARGAYSPSQMAVASPAKPLRFSQANSDRIMM